MSFWTKLRNAATAPFRVVPNFVDDIFHGRNVFDSLGSAALSGYAAADGGKSVLISTSIGKKVTDALDGVTFGFSGDIQTRADLITKINAGGTATKDELKRELFNEGKNAALVYGGTLAAGAAPAGASLGTQAGYAYLGAKGTAGLIKTGDIGGALSAFGPGFGIPDGAGDAYKFANELIKNYKPNEVKFVGAPTSQGYGSNESGYDNGDGGIPPALIAAAVLAVALAVKAARS